jgi:RNA polymerase sigma-70 factor (ECF subfamily)
MRRLKPVASREEARPSDATELMLRAARGDQAAFADLYDVIAPKVHAIAIGVLRDPAQAEEVTQEVLVELWRLATRFDPARGSVMSWAATVAHRRAVDRVRSTQSSRDRDRRDAAASAALTDDVADVVEDRVERERVVQALVSLTAAQREAIELAYWSGYSYREVAILLDVPEGTVKTRIRDGLIRLRDKLEVT